MVLKHGDKVYRAHRYHKLVWDDEKASPLLGFRRYHYEEKLSVALYEPVFGFRYDPVPGVKHWKNSIRGCYRCMRTTQEIRWYYAHKDVVNIRGKRTAVNLPDGYWDSSHARREKGWKRTKKRRQWSKSKDTKRVNSCYDYGTSRGCDEDCPALLGGNCPAPAEVLERLIPHLDREDLNALKDLYNLNNNEYESIW